MVEFALHLVLGMRLLQSGPEIDQATMVSGSSRQERTLLMNEATMAAYDDPPIIRRSTFQSKGVRSISSRQERILLMNEATMAAYDDPQITRRSAFQSKGVRSISSLLHLKVVEPAHMAPAKWKAKWMWLTRKSTSSPG
jgi:hypothetical protein